MESYDCVVVGAGLYGLAAARQFHYTQPDKTLAVFEAQSSIGGTWAEERLYDGLRSNNLLGTYQFPAFPMSAGDFDVRPREHIKGSSIHTYLRAYAATNGLTDLIVLGHRVLSAEHREGDRGGWILTVESSGDGQRRETVARKLIVATGLTSSPAMPHFPGRQSFGGRIFHSKYHAQNLDLLSSASVVTVLGGSKSAWDAAYAYARAGVKVDWIIRSSGGGPCWMSRPYVSPFKIWNEKLTTTRLVTCFSPCIWGSADGYGLFRRLLHGTRLGRMLVDGIWKQASSNILSAGAYDAHPETAKLRPWSESLMFQGDSLSVFNYDSDMLALVRGGAVQVHVGEVDHLSRHAVHLADGSALASDALIAATGWEHTPGIRFLPAGTAASLGVPCLPLESTLSFLPESQQQSLLRRADEDILQRFPRLGPFPLQHADFGPLRTTADTDHGQLDLDGAREQPAAGDNGVREEGTAGLAPHAPYMLHRFMVPTSPRQLELRDIAFVGMMSNTNNALSAHICGLWVAAFFAHDDDNGGGALAVGDAESVLYETVLHNRWGRWRYPRDWGHKRPSFVFDALPYFDLLLRDLGVENRRKGSWLAELFSPYCAGDYEGIEDEWMRRRGARKAGTVDDRRGSRGSIPSYISALAGLLTVMTAIWSVLYRQG